MSMTEYGCCTDECSSIQEIECIKALGLEWGGIV